MLSRYLIVISYFGKKLYLILLRSIYFGLTYRVGNPPKFELILHGRSKELQCRSQLVLEKQSLPVHVRSNQAITVGS